MHELETRNQKTRNSLLLSALDSKVHRLRYVPSNPIDVRSDRQTAELDLLLARYRDQISARIEKLEHDLLIALVLVDLRVES